MNSVVAAYGSGVMNCRRIPQHPVIVASVRPQVSIGNISRSTHATTNCKQPIAYKNALLWVNSRNRALCHRPIRVRQGSYFNQPPAYRATSSSTSSEGRPTSNAKEFNLPPITLDNTIRMKNVALATTLLLFSLGVAYYSMNAVGQAGTMSSTNDESIDPLAVLKAEAAMAQEKYDREKQETTNTADILEKFQKGEYDPDHVSDEELDDMIEPKQKRSWGKFW